jgi:hypothetical protein
VALARADALSRLERGPEAEKELTGLLEKLDGEPAADPEDRENVARALARVTSPAAAAAGDSSGSR